MRNLMLILPLALGAMLVFPGGGSAQEGRDQDRPGMPAGEKKEQVTVRLPFGIEEGQTYSYEVRVSANVPASPDDTDEMTPPRSTDRPGMDRPGSDRPGANRPGADQPGADRPGATLPTDERGKNSRVDIRVTEKTDDGGATLEVTIRPERPPMAGVGRGEDEMVPGSGREDDAGEDDDMAGEEPRPEGTWKATVKVDRNGRILSGPTGDDGSFSGMNQEHLRLHLALILGSGLHASELSSNQTYYLGLDNDKSRTPGAGNVDAARPEREKGKELARTGSQKSLGLRLVSVTGEGERKTARFEILVAGERPGPQPGMRPGGEREQNPRDPMNPGTEGRETPATPRNAGFATYDVSNGLLNMVIYSAGPDHPGMDFEIRRSVAIGAGNADDDESDDDAGKKEYEKRYR